MLFFNENFFKNVAAKIPIYKIRVRKNPRKTINMIWVDFVSMLTPLNFNKHCAKYHHIEKASFLAFHYTWAYYHIPFMSKKPCQSRSK